MFKQHMNLMIWTGILRLQTASRNEFPCKNTILKNIFDFTTAGDWDCVAAEERLHALHYSVDFIFLSFGIVGFIVKLWNN